MRLGRSATNLLRVKNPLREEESLLRPSILPSLLNATKYNFSHGARSVALFETGSVFSSTPSPLDPRLPYEIDRLSWVVAGPTGVFRIGADQLEPDAQFSIALARHLVDVLGVEEVEFVAGQAPGLHPGRTALVVVGGTEIGHVGELLPSAGEAFEIPGRVAVAEIDLDPILKPVPAPVAQEPSVFPHVDFDLSFLTDIAAPVGELMKATTSAASGLVESATVFDEFKGETLGKGKRAVAIRYRLRATDRTLTSEDLAAVRSSMIEAADGLGATLRGA
jgi:phenylalanyl-tRNA synthetase beta chain